MIALGPARNGYKAWEIIRGILDEEEKKVGN